MRDDCGRRLDGYLRVWYLARLIDTGGAGAVSLTELREAVRKHIGWTERHMRRVLTQRNGEMWERGQSRDGTEMLYLFSLERLARLVGVERLSAWVSIPVASLGSLKEWRASAYAAWHKARHAIVLALAAGGSVCRKLRTAQ